METKLSGRLWVLPQLIQIHENKIFFCTRDLQVSVELFAPHDIQVGIYHCLNPL